MATNESSFLSCNDFLLKIGVQVHYQFGTTNLEPVWDGLKLSNRAACINKDFVWLLSTTFVFRISIDHNCCKLSLGKEIFQDWSYKHGTIKSISIRYALQSLIYILWYHQTLTLNHIYSVSILQQVSDMMVTLAIPRRETPRCTFYTNAGPHLCQTMVRTLVFNQ